MEAEAIIIKNRTTIVICILSNFPTISVGLVKILSISEKFWLRKTSDPITMKLGEAIYKSQQSAKPGDAPKDNKQEGKK